MTTTYHWGLDWKDLKAYRRHLKRNKELVGPFLGCNADGQLDTSCTYRELIELIDLQMQTIEELRCEICDLDERKYDCPACDNRENI